MPTLLAKLLLVPTGMIISHRWISGASGKGMSHLEGKARMRVK